MKINFEKREDLELFHKIRYVCGNREEIYDMLLEYLEEVDSSHDFFVKRKIEEQNYSIKYLGKKRLYTTKNAILLAKRLKEELGLILYPMIEIVCVKGYGLGTFKWIMKDLEHDFDYGSEESVAYCLRKKTKFLLSGRTIIAGN